MGSVRVIGTYQVVIVCFSQTKIKTPLKAFRAFNQSSYGFLVWIERKCKIKRVSGCRSVVQ